MAHNQKSKPFPTILAIALIAVAIFALYVFRLYREVSGFSEQKPEALSAPASAHASPVDHGDASPIVGSPHPSSARGNRIDIITPAIPKLIERSAPNAQKALSRDDTDPRPQVMETPPATATTTTAQKSTSASDTQAVRQPSQESTTPKQPPDESVLESRLKDRIERYVSNPDKFGTDKGDGIDSALKPYLDKLRNVGKLDDQDIQSLHDILAKDPGK